VLNEDWFLNYILNYIFKFRF